MRRWQFWLGLVISIALLLYSMRGLHLAEVWQGILNANYWWLVPGVLAYFAGVWVRAWRWHYLLRPLKAVPTQKMFPIVAIGYLGNNILPARAGEVIRAVILKRKEDIPVSASLATVIVERIFDGVVMLGFIFVNLNELARLTGGASVIGDISIQYIAIFGTAAFGGALLVFLLAAMFPAQAQRIVERIAGRLLPARLHEKVSGITNRFLGGLESLRSPREALMVFATSVVIWLFETWKYWFVMHAFNFQVSFFALMLMNGVVNLATTIPSAPGYIGTFDAPGIAVLSAYGVDPNVAASYTYVLHASLWLSINLLGLYYMIREGYRWSDVRQTASARLEERSS